MKMKCFLLSFVITLLVLLSLTKCGGPGLCNGNCEPLKEEMISHHHVAFVSSIRTAGNLNGLAGADSLCESLARAGTKTNRSGGVWKAILSDSQTQPADRISFIDTVGITNTSGEIVVVEAKDLWKGTLLAPIRFDENGGEITANTEVWTGSVAGGLKALGPAFVTSCTDWKDNSTQSNGGQIGFLTATDQRWLEGDDWLGCATTDEKARVYCINSL